MNNFVYDYFKSLFKKDVTNEFVHNEWLNAEYAIGIASDVNQKKMLKCLAIINIVNKPDELAADEQGLYIASGVPDPEATLMGLCAKGLIRVLRQIIIRFYLQSLIRIIFCLNVIIWNIP